MSGENRNRIASPVESLAGLSGRAKAFEAASEDGGQVNFAQFQAGAQTNDSGNCLSGCGSYGFASASADWLTGQFVGNSKPTDGSDPLDGLLTFMTERNQAVSGFWKVVAGPLDGQDNWAGPGGMGPPTGNLGTDGRETWGQTGKPGDRRDVPQFSKRRAAQPFDFADIIDTESTPFLRVLCEGAGTTNPRTAKLRCPRVGPPFVF
jgi:hypothetical protein